ncbi:hypothetical protein ABLG96_01055 [Nakamurella sp. A5-74]|uniref:DNA-binding protein n=1 Tax=Nakamurella sp. A5-74 TaxID=3158264 RepID=A0AAU8DSZ2_9ACTN
MTVIHSPELEALDELIAASPKTHGDHDRELLRRWLDKIRRLEEFSGVTLDTLVDALPDEPVLDARPEAGFTADELHALESVGADLTPLPLLERPSLHTSLRYRQLLDTALSTAEAAVRLGVDGSRIRQRLGNHTLLSHRVGSAHRLPSFQFTDDGELPGWSKVAPHVAPSWHPVAVERFFTSPHVDLVLDDQRVSPREWLLAGGPPETVAALAGE